MKRATFDEVTSMISDMQYDLEQIDLTDEESVKDGINEAQKYLNDIYSKIEYLSNEVFGAQDALWNLLKDY